MHLKKQDSEKVILNNDHLENKISENSSTSNTSFNHLIDNTAGIKPAVILRQIPLSHTQQYFWQGNRLKQSKSCCLPVILKFQGQLNSGALLHSLNSIINRHAILRTTFTEKDGQCYQTIHENLQLNLQIRERQNFSEQDLNNYINDFTNQSFDLQKTGPVSSVLIHLSKQQSVLVLTLHPLVADELSKVIFVKELAEFYNAFIEQRVAGLNSLPLQYADHAVWQHKYLQAGVLEKNTDYWHQKLEGVKPLFLSHSRPSISASGSGTFNFSVDKELYLALQKFTQAHSVYFSTVLLATLKVLLYRYTGQKDICVGTIVANRELSEMQELIGPIQNRLILRDEIIPEASFAALLSQIQTTIKEASLHQEIPVQTLVKIVAEQGYASSSNLFQAMLIFQMRANIAIQLTGGVYMTEKPVASGANESDISFYINLTDNELQASIVYKTDIYKADIIERMALHYRTLLRSAINSATQKIAILPMLLPAEEQQLLRDFNCSNVQYLTDKSITVLFEEQVVRTPQNIAVIFQGNKITYQQFNEQANQLAHYLQSLNIKSGSIVPLYAERSEVMMVALIGIMKAGAAYVPIDPDFPQERKSYMLQEIGSNFIVRINNTPDDLLMSNGVQVITVDSLEVRQQPKTNLIVKPLPSHLAYIIYTSGSTGNPKGTMIEHRSLADYYFGLNKYIAINDCKSFALVSSIATDLGNTVIYASLLSGGALHIFSSESVGDIEYLNSYFNRNKIDCLKIVPSHWQALKTENKLLLPGKLLVFGGEALQAKLLKEIRLSGTQCLIVNHYGPTETTIGKLLHQVNLETDYNETIPIGKPFSNTRIYVLSKEMQLCPIGVQGQLYIAGDGVARGYFKNEELTSQKFIPDLFTDCGASKMYATGDLVKWLPDGNVSFIGRVDDQVKIRGYRVELGEIESVLQQSEMVSQAVVLAREDAQGNKRLVAYIVPHQVFDKHAVKSYLHARLPEYMIPVVWIVLKALPLTTNGKVNRKLLPSPAEDLLTSSYLAPVNETQAKFVAIWQSILQVKRVGITDNFFELGGNSLLAMRLLSAIRKEIKTEMAIRHLFSHPTISKLVIFVEGQGNVSLLPDIELQQRPLHIPLSFNQKGLWFINQVAGSSRQYHLPNIFCLKGKIDIGALSAALRHIVNKHEILRTVIREEDGEGYQLIRQVNEWALSVTDGSAYLNDAVALHFYVKQLTDIPFDLAIDYMLRATLISLKADDHILVVTLHHIASDGWSSSVLIKELAESYNASLKNRTVKLTGLPIQYADYALWQVNYWQSGIWAENLVYWKNKLEDVTPLQLPVDFPRPPIQSIEGALTSIQLNKQLTKKLHTVGQEEGATLFMTLLTALNILLYRYSGQQDICVGVPVAGRQQQELEGLIGFFVNTLALRNELDSNMPFRQFLQRVKANTLDAYDNQEVPFEKVVEAVVKERDPGRNALFQVMLVLQNTPPVEDVHLGEVKLYPWPEASLIHTTSIFDLTFNITEKAHGLNIAVEYCTDLYKEETIKKMLAHFNLLLESIVEAPAQSIGNLQMLTASEQQQLLFDFNPLYVDNSGDKLIMDLFKEQVVATPSAVALVFENEEVTYKELNERSDRFASCLQSKGANINTLVPVCVERGIAMLTAILGILKAGAAYVPVDPEYPASRIKYILEDTAATIIVTSIAARVNLPHEPLLDIIEVDSEWGFIASQKFPLDFKNKNQPCDLAYVIYTSGSTGNPKGVMIEHKNLAASTLARRDFYGNMGSMLLVPSFAFDSSVAAIFGTLISGGKLILCRDGDIKQPKIIEGLLAMAQSILCVPSYYRFLLEDGLVKNSALSKVIVAGENLEDQLAVAHYKLTNNVALYNEYGPTEGTVWSTVANITNEDKGVTIGKPVKSVKVYVLNNELQLVSQGVVGQLCIAGNQVAKGYLNLPKLTNEKFITNPFGDGYERMYKTGDLARWLPGGNIEYLGRMDDQVKVRGYRIELGEIERIIQGFNPVVQSVVLVKNDSNGNKQLAGYIITEEPFEQDQFLLYLKEKLPGYMIPATWVKMEKFPLTSNGKINRKSLPEAGIIELVKGACEAPRNELEIRLAEIWQQLLQVENIGIHNNFFELGGHSLLAIRLVSAIKRKLQIEPAINDLFIYPTIASFANNIYEKITNPLKPSANIKYLVCLNAHGAKKPLYVVCGAGGTALRFKSFTALLDSDQPVYALQPLVAATGKDMPPTIEDIARSFIGEILIENPHGPYALSGHCLGGVIAFEMAKQLQAAGKKVHFLGLFDTTVTKNENKVPPAANNFYHLGYRIKDKFKKLGFKLNFETFLIRKHIRHAIKYKINSLAGVFGKFKKRLLYNIGVSEKGLGVFQEMSEVYINATKTYEITPYKGEIVLFYAAEHYRFVDRNRNIKFRKFHLDDKTKNSWKPYAASLKIYDVKGEHSTMFDVVHGSDFARLLQRELDKK